MFGRPGLRISGAGGLQHVQAAFSTFGMLPRPAFSFAAYVGVAKNQGALIQARDSQAPIRRAPTKRIPTHGISHTVPGSSWMPICRMNLLVTTRLA